MEHSVETRSGKFVQLLTPCVSQIDLGDIAWGLSRTARFNGHTPGDIPYSVAQHSVWVAMIAEVHYNADPHAAKLSLFHDAHEAYTGDIVSPLKKLPEIHGAIRNIESNLQACIHQALMIPNPSDHQEEIISVVDKMALAVEASKFLPSCGEGWSDIWAVPKVIIDTLKPPLPPQQAYELFVLANNYIDQGIALEELWCQS